MVPSNMRSARNDSGCGSSGGGKARFDSASAAQGIRGFWAADSAAQGRCQLRDRHWHARVAHCVRARSHRPAIMTITVVCTGEFEIRQH